MDFIFFFGNWTKLQINQNQCIASGTSTNMYYQHFFLSVHSIFKEHNLHWCTHYIGD